MRRFLVPACALALAFSTPAAAQQKVESLGVTITTQVGLLTDYMFRGISQTRTEPAIQGAVDIEHESGIYVGGFGSNVDFSGLDANLELDGVFGYRFELFGVKLDAGFIYYAYPGYSKPAGGFDLNYYEFALKASYAIGPATLLGAVYYSPDFQLESGTGIYSEAGIDFALPFEFVLSGRLGYQAIDKNERFGTPDFWNWSIGLSREVFGFVFTVAYIDTDISKRECGGGQNICEARAFASVTRKF